MPEVVDEMKESEIIVAKLGVNCGVHASRYNGLDSMKLTFNCHFPVATLTCFAQLNGQVEEREKYKKNIRPFEDSKLGTTLES